MTELDVEINVLSDDGGTLAASLMAASFALISANVECFDIVLAAHFILFDDGRIILDPDMEQITESFHLNKKNLVKLVDTEMEVGTAQLSNKSNCVSVTIAIAPSLGQVCFYLMPKRKFFGFLLRKLFNLGSFF